MLESLKRESLKSPICSPCCIVLVVLFLLACIMLMLLFFHLPVIFPAVPSVDYNVTEQTHENGCVFTSDFSSH